MMLGVLYLVKGMVYITVDPEAPPHSRVISSLLGEIEILEVAIPPLDLPALSLSLGLLEEMSRISDPLLYLVKISLMILIPGFNYPHFVPTISQHVGQVADRPTCCPIIDPSRCYCIDPNRHHCLACSSLFDRCAREGRHPHGSGHPDVWVGATYYSP